MKKIHSTWDVGLGSMEFGDHRKEVHFYEEAIALGFKEEHIFFNLGMAYGELNQTKESIKAFG